LLEVREPFALRANGATVSSALDSAPASTKIEAQSEHFAS